MSDYRLTVGLEVHAELRTKTKMFCDSVNDPEESRPNANVCPVCMAHPGTLPAINREAVKHVLRVGAAIGGTFADYTEFDRKSYFYPDIPKGYQISQYEHPLISGGSLVGVPVTRIHLEEDTARSSHISANGASGAASKSLVDFNRAGVPLMELVTEPEIHDAETAGKFARELQLLLRTLGASHANLEKGEMRVEANISISKTDELGTKVEVKNLNSFRSVERAIAYEVERQSKLIDGGGKVVQETRGWDENKQQTFSQRLKEGSADYRYFPEPDLPKMVLSEVPDFARDAIQAALPELPWDRRARYASLGVKETDAAYLSSTLERNTFFDAVLGLVGADAPLATLAANYIVSDLGGYYAKSNDVEFKNISPESFVALMRMVSANELSSRGAKDVLLVMAESGGDPAQIAKEKGLQQVSDPEALRVSVREVIATQDAVVAEYKAGKDTAIQFLLGQAMKATKGAGNPTVLRELLIEELSA
ncbi:MAG: Asp-tRNA(Asn)/Glu-tRNA(Gln) amidotransferase subunit GatB [Candidatus Pacebacteria bacterium]|nr:Asp-tRNA(Asn)/Glu-tRNA(Gln) amidotransferase subunit GatB [Candidatus Paceibacterota bacterium]